MPVPSCLLDEKLPDGSPRLELTTAEFYNCLECRSDMLLLDVRNPRDFAQARIEARQAPRLQHLPYVAFVEDAATSVAQVAPDREIIVVCARGNSSAYVANILRQHGYAAANLAGGMQAWNNYSLARPVKLTADYQLYQVNRVARGCLSYILISAGAALIIDPHRHHPWYVDFLAEKKARLQTVIETHVHADHISGGRALASATGAAYYLHPYDGIHPFDMLPSAMPFDWLADGQTLTLGALTLTALHTPGHTLGHIVLQARAASGETYAFTGDSVFLESLGRPDLGGQAEAWAPLLYDSLFERLIPHLSPEVLVLPGHYAHPQQANDAGLFISPWADIARTNPGLQHPDKEAFIQATLHNLPPVPPEYVVIKRVNLGLTTPTEAEAAELEVGRNVCAVEYAPPMRLAP